MVTVTLSRGNTSVSFDMLDTENGLALGRDIGKPQLDFYERGREDPDVGDHFSAIDAWTVRGELYSYSDAQTLAETIIKPQLSSALTLDLSNLPSHSTYSVAPVSDAACELTYDPGRGQRVGVKLQLQGVDRVEAASTQSAQGTQSPDSGSGVKIVDPNSNSVTLSEDLAVTRTVGRPNGKLQPAPKTLPVWYDRNKPAVDTFEIAVELRSESTAQTLEETITRARLGDQALTLHFLSNLFSLDAYSVVPQGSQALRTTFSTGETGFVGVPTYSLRVVET